MNDNSSNKIPLSVYIVACNEEIRLPEVLAPLAGWIDEIILVDSGSTDNTVHIAEEHGAKVLYRKWNGSGEQRHFASSQCANKWAMNLDADEILSPALVDEIKTLFKDNNNNPPLDVYNLIIVDQFPFEKIPSKGARRYNIPRLYNREKGEHQQDLVDDRIKMYDTSSKVGQLNSWVYHKSVQDVAHHISKLNDYSNYQVKELMEKGKKVSNLRLITEFPVNFIRYYLFRRYFTGGIFGFGIAMNLAYFRFVRLLKLYEAQRIQQQKNKE